VKVQLSLLDAMEVGLHRYHASKTKNIVGLSL
jgi:hypothetical protein